MITAKVNTASRRYVRRDSVFALIYFQIGGQHVVRSLRIGQVHRQWMFDNVQAARGYWKTLENEIIGAGYSRIN